MSHFSARRWWAGVVITTVVTVVAIVVLAPAPPTKPHSPEQTSGTQSSAVAAAGTTKAEGLAAPGRDSNELGDDGLRNLPPSMAGTTVDGQLRADTHGRLVINHDVRRVFDYFLSAVGEESPEILLSRIRLYLADQLPPSAAAEAEAILFDYLAWQEAAGNLGEQSRVTDLTLDPQRLASRLEQTQALQAQHLGPEVADAFFGDENRYNDYMVQKLALMARDDLSPEAQARQLRQLESNLPSELRQATDQVRQYQSLRAQTSQLEASGATEAEIYQVRAAAVGDDAAARLQTLDRQRAQWQNRMESWLQERDRLLATGGLDSTARQQQINVARQQQFDETELRRVEALERLRDQDRDNPH